MKNILKDKRVLVVSSVLVLLLLVLLGYFYMDSNELSVEFEESINMVEETTKEVGNNFYVDVKGNVKNPGVYEVLEGEVINDIIVKSGGLKKNSYVKNINLSKKVTDEMVINILSIDEYEDLTYECPICICEEVNCDNFTTTKRNEENTTTNLITTRDELTTKKDTTTKETSKPTTKSVSEITTQEVLLVNINTSDLEKLMKLPGIGETIAKRIIEYREYYLFLTIEDIKNVKGIGEALFAKIKDYITV